MSDTYWNYVKLLLHCNGTDNSKKIVNERHVQPTIVGSTCLKTQQKKFDTASVYFNGLTDYMTFPDSAAYAIGANVDFTIEFFAYPRATSNANPTAFAVGSVQTTTGVGVCVDHSAAAGKWCVFVGPISTSTPALISASAVVYDQWVHIAVTRSASTIRLFVDGVLEATATSAAALTAATPKLWFSDTSAAYKYYGYMDEVRLTVGVARYTANFTLPDAAHPHGNQVYDLDYDKVVLHCHFDGEDLGTVLYDQKGHTLTRYGNLAITISASVFGGAALAYDNTTGNYFSANNADFNLSSTDFTIEFWIQPSTGRTPTFSLIASDGATVALSLAVGYSGYTGTLTVMGVGYTVPSVTSTTHIAVVRDGDTLRIYANGVQAYSANSAAALNFNGQLEFGTKSIASGGSGIYDELRITKGLCRYPLGNPFSVPTEPFPNFCPKKLSGTVRDNAGNPISRTVRSYRNSDGLLIDTSVSDAVTGAFQLRATDVSEHYVTVHDTVKNALVYDHITPVL